MKALKAALQLLAVFVLYPTCIVPPAGAVFMAVAAYILIGWGTLFVSVPLAIFMSVTSVKALNTGYNRLWALAERLPIEKES